MIRTLILAALATVVTAYADNHDTASPSLFALRLWREMPRDANAVSSPASARETLALLEPAAAGEAANLLRDTLHPGETAEAFAKRVYSKKPDKDVVHVRRFVLDRTLTPHPDFASRLKDAYGVAIVSAPLIAEGTAARRAIAEDITRATAGRIRDFPDAGVAREPASALLLDALVLTASWSVPFERARTQPAAFTTGDGKTIRVPMMSARALPCRLAETPAYRACELALGEGRLAMLLVVPTASPLTDFEAGLTAAKFDAIRDELVVNETARVELPRFRIRTTSDLTRPVSRLGLGPILQGELPLKISREAPVAGPWQIRQDVTLAVDETGVEASAATEMSNGIGRGAQKPPSGFRADRPFLFAILDTATGEPLFLGRCVAPERSVEPGR